MNKTWSWIKNVFAAIGLFIAGFFLIRRGIDVTGTVEKDPKGKVREQVLKAEAELNKEKQKEKIVKSSEDKKKKAAEDLKKKSKNSKKLQKKKEQNLKGLPKKTQRRSRKS